MWASNEGGDAYFKDGLVGIGVDPSDLLGAEEYLPSLEILDSAYAIYDLGKSFTLSSLSSSWADTTPLDSASFQIEGSYDSINFFAIPHESFVSTMIHDSLWTIFVDFPDSVYARYVKIHYGGKKFKYAVVNAPGKSLYSLYVQGGILAEEIKVTQINTWADYVFDAEYDLMELGQLKEYINNHGHLPNVPSTNQVQQEGLNLVEVDAKLLEKIEELTLYIFQLEDRLRKLESR